MIISLYTLIAAEIIFAIYTLFVEKRYSPLSDVKISFIALLAVLFGTVDGGEKLLEDGASPLSITLYVIWFGLLLAVLTNHLFSAVDKYLKGLR